MKICHIIMSCNRLEYLIPTLNSLSNIDFGEHEIHRLLIDDYPKNRDDNYFRELAVKYKIDELILNSENKGISVVLTFLFLLLKDRGYDYILHQEDDVVLLYPVNVNDWITIVNTPNVCLAVLARQAWYAHESETKALDGDDVWNNYRIEYKKDFFSTMLSLYRTEVMREPIVERWGGINLNEGMMMQYFAEKGMWAANVKTKQGGNMVTHIGEHFSGKRVLPGEPGWDRFKGFDPNKIYDSRTGELIM